MDPQLTLDAPSVVRYSASVLTFPDDQVAEMVERLEAQGYEFDSTPYIWEARISTQKLDSYYTRMDKDTLRNYAEDARAGVSFLIGHRRDTIGIGHSYNGRFVNEPEPASFASFYTVPGITLNGQNSADVITAIKSGLLRDVSVGFKGGWMQCAVCERDLWDWDCPHIPGVRYEDFGVAWAWIRDAHLSEVSGVYDGATPGAEIVKAMRMVSAGQVSQKVTEQLAERFGIRVASNTFYSVPSERDPETEEKETSMEIDLKTILSAVRTAGVPAQEDKVEDAVWALSEKARNVQKELDDVRKELDERGQELERVRAELEKAQEQVEEARAEVAKAKKEADEVRHMAKIGERYQKDMVEAALEAGVRALGDDFNEEAYRNILEKSPMDVVLQMAQDWNRVAKEHLDPGERKTNDDPDSDATLPGYVDPRLYRV